MADDPLVTTSDSPVTVVIATRDRPRLLEDALEATNRAVRPTDHVIVVDSASRDAATIRAIVAGAGATLVRCDEPGTSRARNAGWRAAPTEIVVFTDDDCLPQEGWTAALAAAFDRVAAASFVTGRVVPLVTGSGRARLHLAVTSRDERAVFGPDDDAEEVGHGANMAWRTQALEGIGGFDEELGPGTALRAAEDIDAFRRALAQGGTGLFEPAATVAHRQWRSRAQNLRVYVAYGVGSGALAVKRWRLQHGMTEATSRLPWRVVARHAGRDIVRRRLVEGVGRNVANHYAMGVLAEVAMCAGEMTGVVRARRTPVVEGRFEASG